MKKVLYVIVMLGLTGCHGGGSPQTAAQVACEKGLNVETLFNTFNKLSVDDEIREVTQDYYSETKDHKRSYLPPAILRQAPRDNYLRSSWLGRQNLRQDCKAGRVTSEGYTWSISESTDTSLKMMMEDPANIVITFKKLGDTALLVTEESASSELNYFTRKTVFRWGKSFPESENLSIVFIFGLYEEGLVIPDRVLTDYEERKPGQTSLPVNLDDLKDLQGQLKKHIDERKPISLQNVIPLTFEQPF